MGAVRSRYKPRGLVSAHSSSSFVLGCITAPLLPGSAEETPQHKMLLLPAAALCCLCSHWLPWQQSYDSGPVITDQEIDESVSFSCKGTDRVIVITYSGTRRKRRKHSSDSLY
ncbi:hypothetical protein INR49_008167 [Caranx melampygus]|nr:hypothetical protein INR49_008167 [Caranx melampygus]